MNQNSEKIARLICVDWGSTNFRAFLLDVNGSLIDVIKSTRGVLGVERDEFEPILLNLIRKWIGDDKLPIILSGMVGSVNGWKNTEYVTCPVQINDLAERLSCLTIQNGHKVALISGIENQTCKTVDYDVARGEEAQVIGALSLTGGITSLVKIFCLPGTHSKWVMTDADAIKTISTFMTGELYDILLSHSILKPSTANDAQEMCDDVFLQAVKHAQKEGGFSHHVFSTRTEQLRGRLAPQHTQSYLSGIVIGSELKEMAAKIKPKQEVYVVGDTKLAKLYRLALDQIGIKISCIDGEQAAFTGMYEIAKNAKII